jgi:hypothetical protein
VSGAGMTEARERRSRLSKRALRVWAWIAGGVAFFSPWVALGLAPKPTGQVTSPKARQVIVVRKITRRIIVQDAAKPAPIRYVTSSSSGGSYSPPTTSTSGSRVP